ncbi:hypothetical protein N9S18_01445 [Flavobacteriaceae bacterium]|nr:hypothetical protein [Flavobacteriaceae bacterium]
MKFIFFKILKRVVVFTTPFFISCEDNAYALKVIPDYRPPNLLRFGIAPLYTSYENIFRVLIRIKEIVKTESYKKFEIKKTKVT